MGRQRAAEGAVAKREMRARGKAQDGEEKASSRHNFVFTHEPSVCMGDRREWYSAIRGCYSIRGDKGEWIPDLAVCGDVERNPGPGQSAPGSEDAGRRSRWKEKRTRKKERKKERNEKED